MSQKFKPQKLDDLVNLKNFVNGNLVEMIKPAIKQKSNESVMKMMDLIKEKPDSWFELTSIAIFHQNYQITKYMIESFGITPHQIPLLNASSMVSDISSDSSKQKQTSNKDSFLEVECPLIIQAAIGGDIDIFKYLIDNGFGDNLGVSGHITLSKKYKNSVSTNCIGASAYYGRHKLLQYILENYQRRVDINFRAIEKKCKAKYSNLTKEYSESTPMHLAIESEFISQENCLSCLKILDDYKASIIEYDAKGNSLLHVAAKNNKLPIVKYIIEELHLENLSKETNKEGQTPMSLAQNNQGESICDYLRNNTEPSNENIEEELMDLIKSQPQKKKKGKKHKNKGEKEFGLLNSTDYQETIKAEKGPQPKQVQQPKQSQVSVEKEEKKQIVPSTTKEEEAEYEELEKEEIRRDDYPQQQQQPKEQKKQQPQQHQQQKQQYQQQQQKNSPSYQKQQNSYNRKNYQQRGYNNNYSNEYNNDYGYDYYDYDYYPKGNRQYYDNYDYNTNYYEYHQPNNNSMQSSDYQQKDRGGNKKSYYLQEITSSQPIEKKIESKSPKITAITPQSNEPYIEIKGEEGNNKDNTPRYQKEHSEEEIEDNDEEEDFLEEEPKGYTNVHQEQHQQEQEQQSKMDQKYSQPNLEDKIDYTQLADKYHQLEMKFEMIQKEKRELEVFIQSNHSANKNNSSNIPSTEENINDLLELANEELEQKSKEIAQLQKKIEMINLSNIKSYDLTKLNQMKELYASNLRLINDSILLLENK